MKVEVIFSPFLQRGWSYPSVIKGGAFALSAVTICGASSALAADTEQSQTPSHLLHGAVMSGAPMELAGRWSGVCKATEHDAMKEASAKVEDFTVPVQISLELVKTPDMLELKRLVVTEIVSREAKASDEKPDIEFSHHGNSSKLVISNGAQVVIRGNTTIGGITVGDGARITASGGGGIESSSPSNYNSGIVIGGNATFKGHYFKADDGLNIPNTATIKADRVDLDNKTYYPNGAPIYVTGKHDSGYMIAKLGGESMESVPTSTVSAGSSKDSCPPRSLILLSDTRDSQEEFTSTGDGGSFARKTIVALKDQKGVITGYQRLTCNFKPLSDGHAVGIIIHGENRDADKKLRSSFTMSGNLDCEK